MNLRRLLQPRSVAVVGASERDDSYAGETLLNLRSAGFAGPVWGVHPTRGQAHGYECFPSLSELPEVPDAVVVGIPAASVAEVLDEAGRLGCGGAVVYGAGFGEVASGVELEHDLREVAERHRLPVCGPNGNGMAVRLLTPSEPTSNRKNETDAVPTAPDGAVVALITSVPLIESTSFSAPRSPQNSLKRTAVSSTWVAFSGMKGARPSATLRRTKVSLRMNGS